MPKSTLSKGLWRKSLYVVDLSNLNVYAKSVYAYVSARAGKSGVCTASLSSMSTQLGIAKHTVLNALELLKSQCLLGHALIRIDFSKSGTYNIVVLDITEINTSSHIHQEKHKGKRKLRKTLNTNNLSKTDGAPHAPIFQIKKKITGAPRAPRLGAPAAPPSEQDSVLNNIKEYRVLYQKGAKPLKPQPRIKVAKAHLSEVEINAEERQSLIALAVSLKLTTEQAELVVARAIQDLKTWKLENPSKATKHTDMGRLKGQWGVKLAAKMFIDEAILSQRAERMNTTPPGSARPPSNYGALKDSNRELARKYRDANRERLQGVTIGIGDDSVRVSKGDDRYEIKLHEHGFLQQLECELRKRGWYV
jgi:hypothetical protein